MSTLQFLDPPLARPWAPHLLPSKRTLSHKISSLFANRRVTSLALSCLDPDSLLAWRFNATSVQQAIYAIDHYYERSVAIDRSIAAPMWAEVEHCLANGCAALYSPVWQGFADLKQYALTENRIHAFDPIDPREFTRIVHEKCADVRMARALIWALSEKTACRSVLEFWDSYDECWELIEDVQDLSEDGKDWNFNFWLYSHMAGQSAARGVAGASKALRERLYSLEHSFARLPFLEHDRYRRIYSKTLKIGLQVVSSSWLPMTIIQSRDDISKFSQKPGVAVA